MNSFGIGQKWMNDVLGEYIVGGMEWTGKN